MEEVIESLVVIIKDKTKDFSYMDQDLMFRELASRLYDMSADALKSEYLGEGKEVLNDEQGAKGDRVESAIIQRHP